MRNLVFSLSALLLLFASCGHRVIKGTGDVITETRTVNTFTTIDVSAPVTATIHVVPGAANSVVFSGYKNLLSEINTSVDGNTLKINSRNFINFITDKDVQATITTASLEGLNIHGASDAKIDGAIKAADFKLSISGAGDVSIEQINVSDFEAKISGTGDVTIANGTAENAKFAITGAGNINSFGLQCNNVVAKVSGAGDMEIAALKQLQARVSGAGSIHYKGKPVVKAETSGIGEISEAN